MVKEHLENGLYTRMWHSEKRSVNGVIMIVHGLGEHCERYDAFAAYANERGYHVSSMDLPNHGRSDGPRGHIDSFDVYQKAVLDLYERTVEAFASLPVILLGHSMGGLISSRLLLEHQDKFSCAILSGPLIQSPQEPPFWQVMIIRNIAKWFPRMPMIELDASGVSRDSKVVEKYMADPLISKEKLSAKLLVSMFEAMEEVKAGATNISIPVFVMHGGDDAMTDPEGSKLLSSMLSSKDKALKIYKGLYHEILNEPEGPQIMEEMIDWVESLQQ